MRKFLLNMLAVAGVTALATPAMAEEHSFVGSYVMTNFFISYGEDESYSMDDLPLVIGEGNVIENFALFNPFSTITGAQEGNTITLTCEDEYMILDIDWDTFHYTLLNGETFGDDFEPAPITVTYNPDEDTYEMSSWMLWDYDPFSGEFEKIAYCMVFDLHPGELQEIVDYSGSYLVTGTKTVYAGGTETSSEENFTMTIQPDGTGFYEFTEFAGYEIGLVPRGWLGVYGAVYGNDLEIQGTDIELDENGDGIKLAAPFVNEFDTMYTVTIFFNDQESGTVSDFSVWRMEAGEPAEVLAKWTNLSFNIEGTSTGIQLPATEIEATPEYYDMRGIRVQNPSNGIYIMKKGSETRKVVVRN